MQNRFDSHPLVNTTVYNYLWNLTDPLLSVAHQVAPTTVPADNMGILHQVGTTTFTIDFCNPCFYRQSLFGRERK